MRVLITGGTGFVGANLTRFLLAAGHELHLFIRPESKLWRLESILQQLRVHTVQLEDTDSIRAAIHHIQPAWIFHLGVYGAYSYQTDLIQMIHTNLIGTANLLKACEEVGFEAFVNTGSSSEYGFQDHASSETDRLVPNSYYAVTKAAATHLCSYTSQRLNKRIITLRLYSVYGSYEEPTRLIPRLLRLGMEGQYPPLVSPDTARDFVYIDDVLSAYQQAVLQPDLPLGAVYNIGSGVQTRLDTIVNVTKKLLSIPTEPQWASMPQRIWDTNVWVGNIELARQELGWKPTTSIEIGLGKTWRWLQDHLAYYPL